MHHPSTQVVDAGSNGAALPVRGPRTLAEPLLALAILAGVVGPAVLAATSGNLTIPHSDGWAYSRIAQTFATTGHIRLLDWNRSTLVGQFAVLGPFGRWVAVQQLYVAALGVATLVCVFALAVPHTGRRRAGFAALTIALWPGFGLLATSFMTDIPAAAGALGCVLLGRSAVRRSDRRFLFAALLLGFWAYTVRSECLAAPGAVLLVALAPRQRALRRAALAGAATLLVAVVAFTAWRAGLPHGDHPRIAWTSPLTATAARTLGRGYLTIAFMVAPAVALMARPRRWGMPARVASVATLVLSAVVLLPVDRSQPFLPDYFARSGAYAGVMGDGHDRVIFPAGVWLLFCVVACLSGALLAGMLVAQAQAQAQAQARAQAQAQARAVGWRGSEPVLGLFTALELAGNGVSCLVVQAPLDRYLLPIGPGILIALLAMAPATHLVTNSDRGRLGVRRVGPAALATTIVAAASLATTASGLAADASRWSLARAVSRHTGTAPDRVDAGEEWLCFHSATGVLDRHPVSGYGPEPYCAKSPSCYVISYAPVRGSWPLLGTRSYRTFLLPGAGSSRLYVYATLAAGCGD